MSFPKSNFEVNFSSYLLGRRMFLAVSRAEKWLLHIESFIMQKF